MKGFADQYKYDPVGKDNRTAVNLIERIGIEIVRFARLELEIGHSWSQFTFCLAPWDPFHEISFTTDSEIL